MRSCLGIVLLIILVTAIAVTAFYQWETNSHIEFSARDEGEPELNQSTSPMDKVAPRKPEAPPTIGSDVMQMNVPETPRPAPAAQPKPQGEIETAVPVEPLPAP